MDKVLMVEPGGGLGNRILTLISAFNLARDCSIKEITVLWRNQNECGCDFEDMFDSMPLSCKVRNIHFGKESYKSLLSRGKVFSSLRKAIHFGCYTVFRKHIKRAELRLEQGKNSDSDYRKLKEKVDNWPQKKIYIEAYYSFYGDNSSEGIRFNPEIERRVEDYMKTLGSYVAMHIRRTDNVEAIKNSPTELFYEKIMELVEHDPDKKIYIATDDKDILEDLKRRFPHNIFSEAMASADRRSKEGMQFALYEMLILAGAETLYASYGSTYTMIANIIGKNEMITLRK